MLVSLFFKLVHFIFESGFSLHSFKQLLTRKLFPRSGHDNRYGVMLFNERYALFYLALGDLAGVTEHDTTRIFYLVIEKLTKVFHMHLALVRVNDGGKSVEDCALGVCILDSLYNVGELTYARGLDKYAVGSVFVYNLFERLGKVAHKRATDATRIHLIDLNSRFGKKSAVNSNLAKFVLDKHYFFAFIGLFDKLFDKSGLSRTEKSRKYVNFSHFCAFLI